MSNSQPRRQPGRARRQRRDPKRTQHREPAWRAHPGGKAYDQTRERILAAAVACIAERGHAAVRMHEVAEKAGASRATLYRYFQHKDELLVAVAVHNAERVTAGVVRRIDAVADPQERILEGLIHVVDAFRTDPQLAAANKHPNARIQEVLSRSDTLLGAATQLLESQLEEAPLKSALRSDLAVADAVQWLVFIGIGLVNSGWPVGHDSNSSPTHKDKIRFLKRFLVPSLFSQ